MSNPHDFYQPQTDRGPGAAVQPTDSEIKQGFASSRSETTPALFTPLKIRGTELKNRVVVSPMCMYSSVDGFATNFHLVHVGQLAMRGVSLMIMEATGVAPEGRITPNCLGIWKDEHIEKLREVVAFAHANKALVGIQLAHAGRKASTSPPWLIKSQGYNLDETKGGWPKDIIGPSAIPFDERSFVPREMTLADIQRVQQNFVDAAVRADKAGFDVVELHGAHGYLIQEFLSPISNKRTDAYGGSFENRIRFLVETAQKVRKAWPEHKPLFVRVSSTDWVAPSSDVPTGGWTEEETVELAKVLRAQGVDLVDCSTAGNSPLQKIPLAPGYQVQFATAVRKGAPGMLSGAVGIITDAKQANEIVASGSADLVFMGRQLLRDPNFVLNAALELNAFAQYSHQYERGRPKTKYSFV
ncbi:hypothetical protein EC988_001444 [Linderina pennispora]|nr:hypothetical protein EC988_001444 [Linderina pennispora]